MNNEDKKRPFLRKLLFGLWVSLAFVSLSLYALGILFYAMFEVSTPLLFIAGGLGGLFAYFYERFGGLYG